MSKNQTDPILISIDEAAKELETTPLGVLMHIKRKLLEGQEIDGNWFVEEESLKGFMAGNGKADRTLCKSACAKEGGCASCG